MGADVRLIYLYASPDVLWRRIEARALDGDTFEINREAFELFLHQFEPPAPDERPETI